MPNASCKSGQALEKAQNGNGQLLEKVGMDLGLAPRPLGVGATSAWGWRRVGLGSTESAKSAPRRYTTLLDLVMVPRGGIEPPTLRFSVAELVVSIGITAFHKIS
jgi:hypothetical protein